MDELVVKCIKRDQLTKLFTKGLIEFKIIF